MINHPTSFRPSASQSSRSGNAQSAGLVSFSTSVQEPPSFILDRNLSRLRRMKSGVMTAARLIHERLAASGTRWRAWMLTMTYASGCEYRPYHITTLVRELRKWAQSKKTTLFYVWVAEIQEHRLSAGGSVSECVHYHLLCWLPARLFPPKPDKKGWWPFGSTRREQAFAPLRYLLKYTSKGSSPGVQFPRGLRLHGCGGLNQQQRNERCWWLMPRWVRKLFPADSKPRRAVGGGFVIRTTGSWYPSIYGVYTAAKSVICYLRSDLHVFFDSVQLSQLSEIVGLSL